MKTKILILLLIATFFMYCNAQSQKSFFDPNALGESPELTIKTTHGDISVKLYAETPMHRDNFLKLASTGYYDGVIFHRVIENFMIQTGDPDSKNPQPNKMYGMGGPAERIPAEIRPSLFHKKGALAAARDNNPEKASSGSQFYIVQGNIYNNEQIIQMNESRRQIKLQEAFSVYISKPENAVILQELRDSQEKQDQAAYTKVINSIIPELEKNIGAKEEWELQPEQISAYTTVGGAPHLDGGYTVFGEVTAGLDIIDKIAAVKKDSNDRPLEDIFILKIEPTKKR